MPPKKSAPKKKKAITAVELIDTTTPIALPATLPEVTPILADVKPSAEERVSHNVELQAEPAELVVVGDFEPDVVIESKAAIKHFEPDDIRDAAGDADEAFNFPPPDAAPPVAAERPEWLKYEQDDLLSHYVRPDIRDTQHFTLMFPPHTLRALEDSDCEVEADINNMV